MAGAPETAAIGDAATREAAADEVAAHEAAETETEAHEMAAPDPREIEIEAPEMAASDPTAPEQHLPWSSAEDAVLISGVVELGKRFLHISNRLPGRSGNSTRNRWLRLLKMHPQETAAAVAAAAVSYTHLRAHETG